MTIGGHDVVDILINWFPMILLIGVWFYFLRRSTSGSWGQRQKEALEYQRRQAEALERIAAGLEKRS